LSESLFGERASARAERLRRGPRVSLYAAVSATITRWRLSHFDVVDFLNYGYYQMALFSKKNTIGDGPVQQEYVEKMRTLARGIDHHFNGTLLPGGTKKVGFILMVFPFGDADEGRCNYMSNAERSDVVRMLKEQIKRFETQEAEENDVLFKR